ncbi:unnamed protein product [Rangifer tarandus platyrhynchus]|uniref:Uncharacterized protein n=1 Tax=Rangifer tarandus platyrhynchus TaxID=3082113 RepID=A0ABN8YS71_RANTA|nr:unnamed protein product [Rangifer tarandus platyrhynchus]
MPRVVLTGLIIRCRVEASSAHADVCAGGSDTWLTCPDSSRHSHTPTPAWTQPPSGQRGQVKDFRSLLASARCRGPDVALVGVNDFLFVSSWLVLQHLQSPHLISAPGNKVIKAATISENSSASTGCPAPDSAPS